MAYVKGGQSNTLKDFSVDIDGVKLTQSQVLNIKVKWSIRDLKIIGQLTFVDETDMVEETPIRGGNVVTLSMTDFDDEVSKQTMTVVGVEYTRGQNQAYIVNLDLLDPTSVAALGMYKEMSWAKVGMDEIINHDETLKPLMADKKTDFGSPKNKHEFFVMPMDRSFYKVCDWLKHNNNMLFFQNRESYFLKFYKDLFGGSKKGDKYIYKPNNERYRRTIYELHSKFGNLVEANTLQPKGKVYSLDIFKKEPQETKEDYQGIINKIKSKGKTAHEFGDTGDKHYYSTEFHVEEITEFMYAKNSYKDVRMEILVPGQFATNVGDIIEVDLVNFFTGKEPEKNLNGEWLVEEIVDVIQPPDFVQRITLVRAKFSK